VRRQVKRLQDARGGRRVQVVLPDLDIAEIAQETGRLHVVEPERDDAEVLVVRALILRGLVFLLDPAAIYRFMREQDDRGAAVLDALK
jgi:hypothetical protein